MTPPLGSAGRTPRAQIVAVEAAPFLARILVEAPTDRALAVTIPAPLAPVETLLAVLPGEPGFAWCPPSGAALAGVGSAYRIAIEHTTGPRTARQTAQRLLDELEMIAFDAPGCDEIAPRFFGGLAFAPGANDGAWRAFGDGAFVLPRWSYRREGARAFLTLVVKSDRDRERGSSDLDRERALGDFERILAALARPRVSGAAPSTGARVTQLSSERWAELVEGARAEIVAGRFEKIVVARQAIVEAERTIDAACVLSRLAAAAPDCTLFAVRAGGSTFLGATPERLVARAGDRVLTEALAGSIDAGGKAGSADAADTLLGSTKDLDEHAFVVREIGRRLAPLCTSLDVPERPRIRTLRHLLHLHTPIEGRLDGARHVLDLACALHPTPAVAGLPSDDAVEWIARHEPAPRGWYAGPIGWFDASGDGEFVVALRSALLDGARAIVYAGAGIVEKSDAAIEYGETALKQQSMLAALGVDR